MHNIAIFKRYFHQKSIICLCKNFLSELGDPYRKIIFDKKGVNAIEWGAYGVPESFLIKDGIIIKRYVGPLNQKLFSEINQLIK